MKEFISFETYANDAIKLADMIKKTGRTFKSIIVITRGGLFPAAILSAQLNIKRSILSVLLLIQIKLVVKFRN